MTVESNNQEKNNPQTIIVNQTERQTNGIGTAGFIIAIIAIFLGWIPIVGWLIWFVGLVLSFVGMFRKPKGLAIAGLVISLIGIIILIVIFGALVGSAALMH